MDKEEVEHLVSNPIVECYVSNTLNTGGDGFSNPSDQGTVES